MSVATETGRPLSQRAYEHLVGMMFRQELVPGDALNRREIASELGMSVAPVLEAIVQLEAEGFLVVAPRKGTHVRPLRPADFRGQLMVRMALECQVARMCCGRAIRENYTRLEALAEKADETEHLRVTDWESEIAFHGALAALADCPALAGELERAMRLGHFLAVHTLTHASPVHSRHASLLRALRTTDADRAERAMRKHLIAGRESILQPAGEGA